MLKELFDNYLIDNNRFNYNSDKYSNNKYQATAIEDIYHPTNSFVNALTLIYE